ncbi:MAG TPA: PaaI family thioesterase [Candidatus Limnocylindrales bacterium]|nr:PaaI family thioesterase [Candidatus Limnocylindrales bacterium]
MTPTVTKQELEQLLLETPFAKIYGFKIHEIGEGLCTVQVPFQDIFERPDKILSGPVFMAAADVAMWLAIMTQLGRTPGLVTVEMKTAFLHAARQEDFFCTAKILKLGRRLVYGVAECLNKDGKLLTHHTLTYIRPDSGSYF